MSTKFLSPGWRMPRNANQSKQSNYSMDFDGSSSVINLGNTDAVKLGAGDFTFSAWINPDSWGSSYEGIYSNNSTNGVFIGKDNAGNFVLRITSVSNVISYSTLPTVNTWTHVCITRLNGTCTLYYNGSSVATGSSTQNFNANTNVYIGGDPGTGPSTSALMNGQINQVAIFDYALSPSQVTTLWGGGTSVSNPMALPRTPIAYYPLGTSAWNGNYLAENNAIGDYVFDNKVQISSNGVDLGNTFTISLWFKNNSSSAGTASSDGSTGNMIIKGQAGSTSTMIRFNRNRSIQTYFNSTTISFEEMPSNMYYGDGDWHMVTFVRAANTAKIYIDNNLAMTKTNFGTDSTYFNGTGDSEQFNNKFSNVLAWNTSLSDGGVSDGSQVSSSSEMQTLYNYGSPIQTLANIPQSSNLKAWYKLDASEVYNSSTTEWSIDNNQNPSAYPSSLDFVSSESDYIDCGDSDSLSFVNGTTDLPFSVSTWVNFNDITNSSLFSKTNVAPNFWEYSVHINSDEKIYFGLYSQGDVSGSNYIFVGSTATLTSYEGSWINLTFTYDGSGSVSGLKIYLNGDEMSTSTFVNGTYIAMTNTAAPFRIGRSFNNKYLDGNSSNLALFNSKLSEPQVTELYNNGTPLSDMSSFTSLVSWWKLNNTTTGIEDAKGSNNGTNNGATEYPGFVNILAGDSSGMSQANLVQSDLQTVAPYSKYALNFDASSSDYIDCGTGSRFNIDQITISTWVKLKSGLTSTKIIAGIRNTNNGSICYQLQNQASGKFRFVISQSNGTYVDSVANDVHQYNTWYHVVGVADGSNIKLYVNGSLQTIVSSYDGTIYSPNENFNIGRQSSPSNYYWDGELSNVSVFNTGLTSAQVSEIYNEGLPSNLNNHSAYSNLVSWWQLGENSSFDGNDWIVADEKGTNNGTSVSMPVGALVNGVGTTANGVSTGMSEGSLVGDAPYSTANAISSGMSVVSRVTGSGNTP